ncbi:serum response factor-binding protein 1 [Centropristis striata]|uniref:serum response factor-binding protein 1 n=1 Tax=Centropristis striata TaxID=184440 RepID=UPI0027DF217A|nr:serum response factor-binding protein 1 [Centropristis striata]
MDEVQKIEPSAEENEKEEEDIQKNEVEEVEDDTGDEEEEEAGDDDEDEVGDEKEEEAVPQASDKVEKNIPVPVKPKEKKQDEELNLNNEVVRMRKEVKRVRALTIRKLTRQIGALKKKKGKEMEIERNQRRAARLLEEIHAMKTLSPDLVTKTALQKNLNFEQACKNPKSTISDRAIARIGTHPQFHKKIEAIKAAVKAFKDERMKGGRQAGKEKVQNKAGQVPPQLPDIKGQKKSEKEEKDITVEQKEIIDDEKEDAKDATVAEPEKETVKATPLSDTTDSQKKEMPESKNVRPAVIKSSPVKEVVKNIQSKEAEKEPALKSASEEETEDDEEEEKEEEEEEESDLDSSDEEEKEYFDDSTEERFHKQSSQSEESDSDNGFFLGKVSKFKKKKQKSEEGEKLNKKRETSHQVQDELDELESRLKSKTGRLQTVFCSFLSSSKPGGARGRGGGAFRGQGKPRGGGGINRDFGKQSKFQKQEKGAERSSGPKYSRPFPEGRHPESSEKGFASVGRGRGRGRGGATRQNDRRGGGVFSHQAPQPSLHPSWEASKKRKEQQGQILAFQGKKIKFDDD